MNVRVRNALQPENQAKQCFCYDNGVVMALIYSFGTHLSFKNVKELQGFCEVIERYSLIILNVNI